MFLPSDKNPSYRVILSLKAGRGSISFEIGTKWLGGGGYGGRNPFNYCHSFYILFPIISNIAISKTKPYTFNITGLDKLTLKPGRGGGRMGPSGI